MLSCLSAPVRKSLVWNVKTIWTQAKGRLFCFIPFLGKFGPKNQTVSLSWNSVQILIRISRIRWWFFSFFFETGYTLFGQIWSKKSISLCRNLVLRLIRIWRIQWWCSFFLFMIRSILFFWKLIPRNQYCLLKLKYRT